MAAGKATIVYSFLPLQRYFDKKKKESKKNFMSHVEKGLELFSELVQSAKNYKHKILILNLMRTQIHLLQISSFFHLSSLASFTDSRLRCGNKQKLL